MIIQLLFSDPLAYFMAAVSIALALSIHEYAHAQAADILGDPTARNMGRLTINPLAHFDPLGALLIFTLGFGWGRPVPFNFVNLSNKRWGPALIGLAGPSANLFLALAAGMVLRFAAISNPGLLTFLIFFVWINILLGVFNLLPIPPLDGSHIVAGIAPGFSQQIQQVASQSGFLLLIAALFFMMYVGVPYICVPLFRLIAGTGLGF